MPYTDQTKFAVDYNKVKGRYRTSPDDIDVPAEEAYNLYANTFPLTVTKLTDGSAEQGILVFGRHKWKDDRSTFELQKVAPAEAFDAGAGGQAPDPGIDSDAFGHLPVLLEARWTLLVNDTWLLAGVNNLHEFHLYGPARGIKKADIVNLDAKAPTHRLTVTGREFVGLALAGYREKSGPKGEKFYIHGIDKQQAQDLTLVAYDTGVSNLGIFESGVTEEEVKSFFKKAGFTIQWE